MCLISYSTCAVMKFFFVLGSIGDLFSSFGNGHLVSCFLFSLSNLAISTLPRRWQVVVLVFSHDNQHIYMHFSFICCCYSLYHNSSFSFGSSYRVRASTGFVSCDFMNFTQSLLNYFTRVSSSIVKFQQASVQMSLMRAFAGAGRQVCVLVGIFPLLILRIRGNSCQVFINVSRL